MKLPVPKHELGYTYDEIKSFMTAQEYEKFCEWMNGQTCAIEDDVIYVYECDVERFLAMVRRGKPTYWD